MCLCVALISIYYVYMYICWIATVPVKPHSNLALVIKEKQHSILTLSACDSHLGAIKLVDEGHCNAFFECTPAVSEGFHLDPRGACSPLVALASLLLLSEATGLSSCGTHYLGTLLLKQKQQDQGGFNGETPNTKVLVLRCDFSCGEPPCVCLGESCRL